MGWGWERGVEHEILSWTNGRTEEEWLTRKKTSMTTRWGVELGSHVEPASCSERNFLPIPSPHRHPCQTGFEVNISHMTPITWSGRGSAVSCSSLMQTFWPAASCYWSDRLSARRRMRRSGHLWQRDTGGQGHLRGEGSGQKLEPASF